MDGLALWGHWEPRRLRRLAPHTNPGLEIVYIAKGHLHWSIAGREEAIGPGAVFFSLPWQVHGGPGELDPGSELFFVVIRLDQEYHQPRQRFGLHPDFGLSDAPAAQWRRL